MKYLLALIAAILGGGLGLALGVAAGALLAELFAISSREGAAGYFAFFTGGPIGLLVGLIGAPVLVLRWAGHRSFQAVAGRLVVIIAAVIALGAAGVGAVWMMRPFVNTNGPAPQLVFEIRLAPGVAPPDMKTFSAIELQTSKNQMPATIDKIVREDGRAVVSGRVDLYFRVWQRMLVVKLPDKTDIIFDLSLGLTPGHTKVMGAWQRATYIGEPGKDEARRTTAADQYDIRYRIEWAGEE